MTQDDSEIDYYRDNALTHSSDDQFQHKHYVEVLKDILLKSETPINIGLYGKWGVGKSSIVHMLKEEIEKGGELENFEYVEVDAWGISGKSLQQGILEEINAKLQRGPLKRNPFKQEELEDKLYNVHHVDSVELNKWFNNHRGLWGLIAVLVIVGLITSLIIQPKDYVYPILSTIGFTSIIVVLTSLSKLFFKTAKKIIPSTVSTVQFNKIYDKMIQKHKKLVVVIDNLDRCEDTVAVELLGIIQTFMVKQNCINILACDDEAIVTHLKNVKKHYTNNDGNEFLSKFFQVTIRIPPFIGENLSEYAEKLIKKRSVKFDPYVKPILISSVIENPRKINQFLNIAVALYKLAEFKENKSKLEKGIITKNTSFLMKIIVIKHEWPEFYKALELNPKLLINDNELENWFTDQSNNDDGIDKEEISRLKKFHNSTIQAYAKDITPFLQLNQKSYAMLSGIGKFEDAFITQDSKAAEMFKELDDEKQEKYLSKINDIMDEHGIKLEKLNLLNCVLSLIGILQHIPDGVLRTRALAILGSSMYLYLLEDLDKLDIDKLNLFNILEEMRDNFSEAVYMQLINKIFAKGKVDEDLLEKFFKNGNVINTKILDQLDSKFAKMIDTNYSNVEFITKLIKNYHWTKNKITKPSKIISTVISKINFDEAPESQTFKGIYENIKDSITDEENQVYYEKISEIIEKATNANSALHPSLLEELEKNPIENAKTSPKLKQEIFVSLCNLIKKNPDMVQNTQILKLIIPLYQKIEESDSSEKYLEKAFINYLKLADPNMLQNMINILSSNQFLKNAEIMVAVIERYEALGSNNSYIIKFLLENSPHETKDIVINKFEEMITSREESKFTTLLTVAKENNEEFDSNLIRGIRKICMLEANDEENQIRHSMYEHVLELNPDSDDKSRIVDYATALISNEETSIQDLGFALLKTINIRFDQVEPAGVTDAISIAIDLISNNSERVVTYIKFIFEYKDRFRNSQNYDFILFIQEVLQSDASENILNNLIACVKQLPVEIITDVFDELVDFAENTTYVDAKEQCKQIFITHKDKLRLRHKNKIKKIFGESILD